MDRHAGSSLTLQGVRAKRTAPKDPSAIVGDSLNEAGPADRDPSSCSVRCNTLESPVPQPASALGPSRGGSGSLLGNSPFDIGHIAETAADEDAAPRNSDHGGSAEISRSGSWPGLMVDDLDSMFECMLNLRNLKGSVESKESRHVGSQRLSRYVEAVSRTSSRRSGRWSPKRSTASPLGDQSAREKKVALWIQLIKGLRMKRWTQLLATVNKKEPSDKAAAKGAEKVAESGVKHACTVVEIVCDASAARDSDERGVAPEEKVMSSVDAAKQYARFRPRSVANDAKHEPLSSIRGVSNTFAPSAAVRRGYMSDVDAVNYGLVRIREAGVSHQVYDCVEKETGRMLSVKLIPRDHGAAELYEQLCESGHENFISVPPQDLHGGDAQEHRAEPAGGDGLPPQAGPGGGGAEHGLGDDPPAGGRRGRRQDIQPRQRVRGQVPAGRRGAARRVRGARAGRGGADVLQRHLEPRSAAVHAGGRAAALQELHDELLRGPHGRGEGDAPGLHLGAVGRRPQHEGLLRQVPAGGPQAAHLLRDGGVHTPLGARVNCFNVASVLVLKVRRGVAGGAGAQAPPAEVGEAVLAADFKMMDEIANLKVDARGFVADEARDRVFKQLRAQPENAVCIDCNARNPTWISLTFAVHLCLNCSGRHRQFGSHISFVRSADMDKFTREQLIRVAHGGNARAKAHFKQSGLAKQPYDYTTAMAQRYPAQLDAELGTGQPQQAAAAPALDLIDMGEDVGGVGKEANGDGVAPLVGLEGSVGSRTDDLLDFDQAASGSSGEAAGYEQRGGMNTEDAFNFGEAAAATVAPTPMTLGRGGAAGQRTSPIRSNNAASHGAKLGGRVNVDFDAFEKEIMSEVAQKERAIARGAAAGAGLGARNQSGPMTLGSSRHGAAPQPVMKSIGGGAAVAADGGVAPMSNGEGAEASAAKSSVAPAAAVKPQAPKSLPPLDLTHVAGRTGFSSDEAFGRVKRDEPPPVNTNLNPYSSSLSSDEYFGRQPRARGSPDTFEERAVQNIKEGIATAIKEGNKLYGMAKRWLNS
ncbi:GTP-ase activating protein for Arf, putative [Babesia caballi]|uniref:GTP-ase activating protein for Arf, putative n=1 Tax=Babesia caballi TaxID=5871 RepID=A0AAV4LRA1_BABCB|nr:GTP-ase activating protein for Arf, putative [Babesia caballi]